MRCTAKRHGGNRLRHPTDTPQASHAVEFLIDFRDLRIALSFDVEKSDANK